MLHRILIPLSPNTSKVTEEKLIAALGAIPGVIIALNNAQTEMIYVAYHQENTQLEQLNAVLHASGFTEIPRTHNSNFKSPTFPA